MDISIEIIDFVYFTLFIHDLIFVPIFCFLFLRRDKN